MAVGSDTLAMTDPPLMCGAMAKLSLTAMARTIGKTLRADLATPEIHPALARFCQPPPAERS